MLPKPETTDRQKTETTQIKGGDKWNSDSTARK